MNVVNIPNYAAAEVAAQLPPLAPNGQGLIVLSNSNFPSSHFSPGGRYLSSSGYLCRQFVVFATTFWGKLLWPGIEMEGFPETCSSRLSDFDQELEKNGVLKNPVIPYQGSVRSFATSADGYQMDEGMLNELASFQKATFEALNNRERGQWSYCDQSRKLVGEDRTFDNGGYKVQLTQAIPIVRDVNDPHKLLMFVEKRDAEIRRVNMSLRHLITDIEMANPVSVQEVVTEKAKEIYSVSRDLLDATRDFGGGVSMLGITLHFSYEKSIKNTLVVGAAGGKFAEHLFGPEVTGSAAIIAAFAGLSTSIRFSRDKRRSLVANTNFPYAVIPKLQFGA